MKKNTWRSSELRNRVEEDDLKNSEIGQLLSYMLGHCAIQISRHIVPQPLLGIYMEGPKVIIIIFKVDRSFLLLLFRWF